MVRLAEFVLRHRKLVMLFWLVMFLVGGVAAGKTSERLTIDFSLPGQPGYETEKQILDIYNNGGSNPPTIAVVTVPEGSTVEDHLDEIVFAAAEGPVRLKLVKPCVRCSIPDVDPATGAAGHAVGDVLSHYRADPRMGGAITFAMNAIVVEGIDCTLTTGMSGSARYAFA